MRLIPNWITLPVLVFLYKPVVRLFPKTVNKDSYVRRVVAASNSYFFKRFVKIPFHKRMLFLPYCLRPKECPTMIDPQKGLQCPDECSVECGLREIRGVARELGYTGSHIVVSGKLHKDKGILRSRDFLVKQIDLNRPGGVVGCLCTKDLRQKYLNPQNLSPNGTLRKNGHSVIPQVVLLANCNCRQSSVDWRYLKDLIQARM